MNKNWDVWTGAFNCRVSIAANPGLNGKLIVDIKKVDNADAYIYLQPNQFSHVLSET